MSTSIAPTKTFRVFAAKLWGYALIAMSPDIPLPKRLVAIDMLRINFDQLFAPSFIPESMREVIAEGLQLTYEYMKELGYPVSPPPKAAFKHDLVSKWEAERRGEVVDESPVLRWIRNEFKRKEGERIMDYVDRVSKLAARVLAIYAYVTASALY